MPINQVAGLLFLITCWSIGGELKNHVFAQQQA